MLPRASVVSTGRSRCAASEARRPNTVPAVLTLARWRLSGPCRRKNVSQVSMHHHFFARA